MLSIITVILIVLWLLGLVTGYTMGYFIHILLVVAIIVSCWSESFRGDECCKQEVR